MLSDVRAYPYFFRTIPTNIVVLDAILALVRAAGWKRISLFYDNEYLGWAGKVGMYDPIAEIHICRGLQLTFFFTFSIRSRVFFGEGRQNGHLHSRLRVFVDSRRAV